MEDLITIIVPVYKVEEYLHRCVDSILRQTYQNLEIILVDDGSPDGCGEICEQYALKDDRIQVIHKENGGLSDARNAGIERARGAFLSFLDSDDWIADHYIETLYGLMVSKGADISVCGFIRTDTEQFDLAGSQNDVFEFSNIEALQKLCDEFYVQLTVSWGKLYKTDLFSEVRFPLGKIHEDEYTTYKLLYQAHHIVVTSEPLLYYWQRPDSIMGNGFKLKNKMHAIDAFEERADFFHRIGQLRLMEQTYKALFVIYREVNENIDRIEDDCSKKAYKNKLKDFKMKLRNTRQSIKFKVFYELYFLSPALASKLEVITRSMK